MLRKVNLLVLASVALSIFTSTAVFAGGTPHSVVGKIYNQDGSTYPGMGELQMNAYIDYDPGVSETRNYNSSSPDNAVKYGSQTLFDLPWYEIECANFSTGSWSAGDILYLDITNTANGQHSQKQIILTNNEPQVVDDISLPVHMSDVSANVSRQAGVTVIWRTESEVDCAGFYVWRMVESDSAYMKITTACIPGQGNSSSAHEYSFVDRNVIDDKVYHYKIEEISSKGLSTFYGPIRIVGVNPIPTQYGLSHNYPNPFNPRTTFDYQLPEDADVTLRIFNEIGQEVMMWSYHKSPAGYYSLSWEGVDKYGRNVSSGIYLIHMQTEKYQMTQKIMLLR